MRRLLALSFVFLMVVAFAAPAGAHEGFVLFGADAAYATFTNNDGCTASVGYVDAKGVKYFHGPLDRPHEDVQVELGEGCGASSGSSGTENISGGHPGANLVKLTSATLGSPGQPFVIDDNGFDAIIRLDWNAYGDAYTVTINEPGKRAAHRMKDATLHVDGWFEVEGILFTAADLVANSSVITHYTEIQNDNLP